MDEKYMNQIKKASGEIWMLFKEYIGIKNDDEKRWEELIKVADEFYKRYKGTEAETYARKYVGVIIDEIERVSKL